jgi:hypothetical protein
MNNLFRLIAASIAICAGLIAGCGGGGGTPAAAPATSSVLSGSVVKGPVGGGTVVARAANTGTILGTATTSPSGTYSMTITYNGDVVLEVSGGTYRDEATGLTTTLNQLKAIINANGTTQTVHLTPLTYIAYGYAGNTSAGFNTALTNLATQFGLGTTNLLTTLPAVSGTVNDYGRVLRAMSQYVQSQSLANFEAFIGQALTPSTFTSIQANFAAAFNTINPGQTLTFNFNGASITIGGTGVGGGSGTCGVAISGTVPSPGSGVSIPFSGNYCVTGIAAGSCTNSNTSLTTAIPLGIGATGVTYTTSASCAAGAIAINLGP